MRTRDKAEGAREGGRSVGEGSGVKETIRPKDLRLPYIYNRLPTFSFLVRV